ncbi:CYTH-like domain-containing protein [Fimicolochytrium jonesii]|uniref:CYTH-like domain-containing protein n=1 Tax=Fimicolochytrium jonesii TaxID=1396493 RepID=UPI0022FF3B6F|nr:CYTH-like domain-containing protein [Fimicolochytrium jonesii]KAI8819326.1 CYTH-like domain-containing protein [Fimicolochytrium jonesii]
MEVEVKLRLSTQAAFDRVLDALKTSEECPGVLRVDVQENWYFDTPTADLERSRSVLRVRRSISRDTGDSHAKCTATSKGEATLVDGISRVEEFEIPIECDALQRIVNNPSSFCTNIHTKEFWKKLMPLWNDASQLHVIGKYFTERHKIKWRSWNLEIDSTTYDFGKAFEIEIETERPHEAKREMPTTSHTPQVNATRCIICEWDP